MTVNKRTKSKGTIIEAALGRDMPRVRAALDAGENVDERDADSRTALHHACIQGQEELVDLLLSFKADVACADSNGWTPLHFAAQSYGVSIAQKLIGAGARVDAVDAHGNTPLFRAVFESKGRGLMIRLLLEKGANRDQKNNHGTSPAALAATIANFDVAQWMAP